MTVAPAPSPEPAPDARQLTIAVDGPAASGKSTVGALLAQRLGYLYFDTGVMYRAVTWAALRRNVPIEDEPAVTALAQTLTIDVLAPNEPDGRQSTVLADGEDVTWAIRQPDVNRYVSTVSAYPGVRTALTAQQRRIASRGDIVMVGRDIGTVVLPNADLKVYLSASAEERARRRWLEEQARDGQRSLAEVLDDVRLRDRVDSNRAVSPLRAASDAMVIDTSDRTVEEVVATIVQRLALGVRNLGDLPS